jgi:hypothetical protein
MLALLMHKIPLSDTMILLEGIYLLLQNTSEIHLLPTITAQNQLSSDLQNLKLQYVMVAFDGPVKHYRQK